MFGLNRWQIGFQPGCEGCHPDLSFCSINSTSNKASVLALSSYYSDHCFRYTHTLGCGIRYICILHSATSRNNFVLKLWHSSFLQSLFCIVQSKYYYACFFPPRELCACTHPSEGLNEGQARLEMSVMRLSDIGGLLLEAHRCSQALIKSLRFSVSSMNAPLV